MMWEIDSVHGTVTRYGDTVAWRKRSAVQVYIAPQKQTSNSHLSRMQG